MKFRNPQLGFDKPYQFHYWVLKSLINSTTGYRKTSSILQLGIEKLHPVYNWASINLIKSTTGYRKTSLIVQLGIEKLHQIYHWILKNLINSTTGYRKTIPFSKMTRNKRSYTNSILMNDHSADLAPDRLRLKPLCGPYMLYNAALPN